jgi:hypothetical protein
VTFKLVPPCSACPSDTFDIQIYALSTSGTSLLNCSYKLQASAPTGVDPVIVSRDTNPTANGLTYVSKTSHVPLFANDLDHDLEAADAVEVLYDATGLGVTLTSTYKLIETITIKRAADGDLTLTLVDAYATTLDGSSNPVPFDTVTIDTNGNDEIVVVDDGNTAPSLVHICDNIGDSTGDKKAFISPISYDAANGFDWFPIQLDRPATLSASCPTSTNMATPPNVSSLEIDDSCGRHVLFLDGGVPQQEWTSITLTLVNKCGAAQTVECIQVAHLPCDNNGDGNVGLADSSAFVNEYNGQARPLLVDINDDGEVGPADNSAWVNNYNGNAGIGIPQANGTFLPTKPACACP